jgi:hypothetical protein
MRDWEEIVYALDLKAEQIESGLYDNETREAERPGSETARWAKHLRRIIRDIGRATTVTI